MYSNRMNQPPKFHIYPSLLLEDNHWGTPTEQFGFVPGVVERDI